MPRFIHTSDWQLGMTRRFLNPDAHALYSQARINVIKKIGAVAKAEGCSFIAVAGDVFEYEQMDRLTVARALEAMGETGVPVVLLPGNHDPYHDDSVYCAEQFAQRTQRNIIVLADAKPVPVADGIEVVGAPWHSKHPTGNPIIKALADLEPASGILRVCLAHGYVDIRAFDEEAEALIPVDQVERAIAEGKIHYVALGDRHSSDTIDAAGRIRYSGTPECTDFDEVRPGYVHLVDLSHDGVAVEERKVGSWHFLKLNRDLAGPDDVDTLLHELEAVPDKSAVMVRLDLTGSLGLAEDERLRGGLGELRLRFAGVDVRDSAYFVNTGDTEKLCAHLSGYAADAAGQLRSLAAADGSDARAAADALLLLARLAPAAKED